MRIDDVTEKGILSSTRQISDIQSGTHHRPTDEDIKISKVFRIRNWAIVESSQRELTHRHRKLRTERNKKSPCQTDEEIVPEKTSEALPSQIESRSQADGAYASKRPSNTLIHMLKGQSLDISYI